MSVLQSIRDLQARIKAFASLGAQLEQRMAEVSTRIDALSSKVELGPVLPEQLLRDRELPEYLVRYEREQPLVSVCIATYNRSELLLRRSIRSILAQDYKNLQVVVVGDACTDDTERRVGELRDSRVSFYNLPERGRYPSEKELRWMVAGTAPMNEALRRCEGDFVTHLDDDDEHLPGRVSTLVDAIRRSRAELLFHPFSAERPDGTWRRFAAYPEIGSIFYHRWFARIGWDMDAYRLKEPGDWNRLRKFLYLGAKLERHPDSLLKHFRERGQGTP